MLALWSVMGVGLWFALTPLVHADDPDDLLRSDHEAARQLVRSGQIVPLEQIVRTMPAMGQGRILEVELEQKHGRYQYEIEWVDAAGHVWKGKWDAATGMALKQKLKE
ncbi:MAG: peptidase M4 [Magnetococcales bacterium]|nr:peptidase M4 [Magnetococcales bacterium]